MDLSETFRALGDETRLRILNLLSNQELCVCQIIDVLRLNQPNASKHLKILRYAGIITCRKISQWCFYSINENFISQNLILHEYLASQWPKKKQFSDDLRKLEYLQRTDNYCKKLLESHKPDLK